MHKHTELLSMFWDRVAPLYDFFGNAFNRADYDGTGEAVARDDCVLECACCTGAISGSSELSVGDRVLVGGCG